MPQQPNSIVTKLDQQQILQRVYDEANDRLRTDATLTTDGGDVEVAIVHTEDSVRLGNGTNFITTTSSGGKVAIDVALIPANNPIALNPAVVNVALPIANTEASYTFTADTKKVFMQSRKGNVQFAYVSGQSGTNFISLNYGASYYIENINLNGITVYFQSDVATDVVEIHTWT